MAPGASAESAIVFDRRLLRRRRARAAHRLDGRDVLLTELAERLVDRLGDLRRDFPVALDLGCHRGEVAAALAEAPVELRRRVGRLISADLAPAMAARAPAPALAADEEALPFATGSLDLVMSAGSLHWVNDLPGALVQIRRALRPDGLFLAALCGGARLGELREAWVHAELAQDGGVSPRVAPLPELRDAADLLQRAGFALPVADLDRVTVTYANALALMEELAAVMPGRTGAFRRPFTFSISPPGRPPPPSRGPWRPGVRATAWPTR